MSLLHSLRRTIKARDNVVTDALYRLITGAKYFSLPPIPVVHVTLFTLYRLLHGLWETFVRMFVTTPLFQTQLERPAAQLHLYGMPLVLGTLRIRIGSRCRVGGNMNISGFTGSVEPPLLEVGNNCDLGWGGSIMVGRRVTIGNNVRLAAACLLVGYSGHPLDAAARARGEGDTPDQIGDITLEDDVWLGTRVTVLRGVTIGRGTIVGTGSVVTRDLPPFVLAAGNPARVIRPLPQDSAVSVDATLEGAAEANSHSSDASGSARKGGAAG